MLARFALVGLLVLTPGHVFSREVLLRCEENNGKFSLPVKINLEQSTAVTGKPGWSVEVLPNGWRLSQPDRQFSILNQTSSINYVGHYEQSVTRSTEQPIIFVCSVQ